MKNEHTMSPVAIAAMAISILIAAVAFSVVSYIPRDAHANRSYTCYDATTDSTSTLRYITAGTGTSTLTISNCYSRTDVLDGASLLVQLSGSSTASKLNIAVEYSQDGIDWYANNYGTQGTTTPSQDISTPFNFLVSFASTTPGGQAPGLNRMLKAIKLDTPTNYVRVVFTAPAGSTNLAFWATIIGRREQSEAR